MGTSEARKNHLTAMINFETEKKNYEENRYHNLYTQKEAFDCSMLELQLAANWLFEEAMEDPTLLAKLKEMSSQIHALAVESQCPYEITLGPLISKTN